MYTSKSDTDSRSSSTSNIHKNSTFNSQYTEISPSSSHFFEVLYIGKIRVSNRKINEAFIDAALVKFRQNELHRHLSKNGYQHIRRPSQDVEIKLGENGYDHSKSSSFRVLSEINKPPTERSRANSIASFHTSGGENSSHRSDDVEMNRTMVFHVGRTDLRLISTDRKEVLLYKQLRDVINCVHGKEETDHFGVICRDPNSPNTYLGYVFKCESNSVVSEIIGAITQSHALGKKKSNVVMNCEHCPMVWFQRLLNEIEGMKDQDTQNTILKRLEELPEDEQEMILNKLNATASISIIDDNCKEQNQLLLTLLKAHCDGKQSRHVHDTVENRHEFLNHYLGGGTIFMKAKRSLTSSFDQLLKRKPSRDDFGVINKEAIAPPAKPAAITKEHSQSSISSLDVVEENNAPKNVNSLSSIVKEKESGYLSDSASPHKGGLNSPKNMREIFLKVGNSPRASIVPSDNEADDLENEGGSWRHNIFKNVVTPNKLAKEAPIKARGKEELRALWKKAINQQILLIRMEKENAKLYARQEEATMKRIKLEYDDICTSGKENTEVWEVMINKGNRKYDDQMLLQAVRKGVPRSRRGDVWIFLAEHYCSKMPPPIDCYKFPKYNVPYEQLLKELTSQQHAILIDLGRTFPNHSYFMSPLGPGQLGLYNLLKAYSLLDEEVGYCQGLSFIAGILLLHMSEDQAFIMLRHLMFRRNLRQQYLPDMAGLQVQLYQLTRLLKDYLPELYEHFDKHEISPILYAAPWILTIFASQFPLGFVVRIFDLIFVEGSGVLFKVILALLSHHKDALLACDGFESIMDYLKITVPEIDKNVLDLVIKQVSTTDITKPLLEYNVEYHVLQEELSTPRPETKKLKQMEEVNKALKEKNQSLMEQLEIALSNNSRLETVRVKHLSQINKLESEVRALEVTVNTLGNFISTIAYGKSDIEIPNDVLRILSQLNMAERRRSLPKSSLTDLNVDFKAAKDQHITLGQIKSNSLTPKMGSSYFANSFDQIRQQKLNQLPNNVNNKKLQEVSDSSKHFTKSLSDTRNIKFDKIIEESADRSQSLGRVLSPQEMETLKLFQKNYSKELRKNEDTVKTKAPMLTSKSSFELGVPSNLLQTDGNSPYPLNCGGVQISFAGSTKLKSLRPSRIKTEMHINVPKHLIKEHSSSSENNNSVDNNDSAFDESVESIDSNGNLSDKAESTVSAVQDSKMCNSDITIS
ncbi:TBC1 domain family member 1 isoform X2 [Planococcus citri]